MEGIYVDTTPEGYWADAKGNLIPEGNVKEIDKLRDGVVKELIGKAKNISGTIAAFKGEAMGDIEAFVEMSAEKYEAKIGGKKGNVTLYTHNGRYKIVRQIGDNMRFDERINAAKALIDECLLEWTEDGRDEIKTIVASAFDVDKEGDVNVPKILALRRHDINDPRWQRAMKAISESLQIVGTKPYVRFYERKEDGSYKPISLDIASS
jgi:hypothetical protein